MQNGSRFSSVDEALAHLHSLGYLYPDATQGMQYDLVAAFKPSEGGNLTQASLCGFNCGTEKGNYDCFARSLANIGASKATFAPATFIVDKAAIVEVGLDMVREWFVETGVHRFCADCEVEDSMVKEALQKSFSVKRTEFNGFGGDPEQHPEIIQIIRRIKRLGMKFNLTATGGRWTHDQRFVDELLEDPPQVVCVSYDTPTLEEFHRYSEMSVGQLKAEITKIDRAGDWDNGQKKKAIASIAVAVILSEQPGGLPCGLLFNTVLHPGNIEHIDEITAAVEQRFPGSIVNPYPGQSAYEYQVQSMPEHYLKGLERFVDDAIEKTKSGVRFVKRLHYWLMLKAVFDYFGEDRESLAKAMSGYGVWTCFEEEMAGYYVQPARSVKPRKPSRALKGKVVRREDVDEIPGAYLGCTWNPFTVTDNDRQIEEPQQVLDHVIWRMTALAKEAGEHACPGSLMPRLGFNGVSQERGMNKRFRPGYRIGRRLHAGF